MIARASVSLALAFALVCPAIAHAQTPAANDAPLPAVPPRVGVTGAPPAPITIQDAVRMALEHNTDVAIARLAREVAEQDIRAAEGVFDVRFAFELGSDDLPELLFDVLSDQENDLPEARP